MTAGGGAAGRLLPPAAPPSARPGGEAAARLGGRLVTPPRPAPRLFPSPRPLPLALRMRAPWEPVCGRGRASSWARWSRVRRRHVCEGLCGAACRSEAVRARGAAPSHGTFSPFVTGGSGSTGHAKNFFLTKFPLLQFVPITLILSLSS